MHVGHNLDEGRKIGAAIHRLKGTSIAQLEPARQNQNHKVKTIDGITKLFYFEWPIEGDYAGFIQARCLPHIGKFYQFSPTPHHLQFLLIHYLKNNGTSHYLIFKVNKL